MRVPSADRSERTGLGAPGPTVGPVREGGRVTTAGHVARRPGLWAMIRDVVVRPSRAFAELPSTTDAAKLGLQALLVIGGAYTVVLGVFIAVGWSAVAPSALPVALDDQYRLQILYQVPLYLLATVASATALMTVLRATGRRTDMRTAFAAVAFASVVPFLWTTLVVELVLAFGLAVGAFEVDAARGWLLEDGTWFTTAYQLVAAIWAVTLFVIAARRVARAGWPTAFGAAVAALVIYVIPVALLIR